ncbi:ParB-like nuclease domain protein [Microbacterium phage Avocadoman]|uniref:ParB-like nuclease domain protein n=1 Tax=Microbacterium phage Avocadoman TaxID=2776864 RepID=UPI0018A42237|nr:ParB-like nuclease domain protein [Microbacterium phage Avocadoman]QOP64875.1 ParB-like nuclease domain protein [Microbacterium phage Avocadoman]
MLAIEPARPDTVVHWAIAEVVTHRSSDLSWYKDWDELLREKRADRHYPDVVKSIREYGFLRPLNASIGDGELMLSDGHHRIAAAIDLGLECVPVYVAAFHVIADDSGSWRDGEPIELDPTNFDDYINGGAWLS